MADRAYIASLGREVDLRPQGHWKPRLKLSDFGGLVRCYAFGLDYGLNVERALEIQQFRASLIIRPHVIERGTVSVYSHMVRCKISQMQQPDWLHGVTRGTVTADFVGKKRKRLFDKFNSWRMPGHHGRFVTLTYPDEFPMDWKAWKSDLEKYRRALLRRYPNAEGIWRLELQRRGAPHYHIMLYTHQPEKIAKFKRWNDKTWARIAHAHDKYGGKYACNVSPVWSRGQAIAYLGKYCGKVGKAPADDDGVILTPQDMGESTGRQWGTIGKLDCRPYAVVSLPAYTTGIVRRQLALFAHALGNKYAGNLWNVPDRATWTLYGVGQTPTRDMRIPGCDPPPISEVMTHIARRALENGTWSQLLG